MHNPGAINIYSLLGPAFDLTFTDNAINSSLVQVGNMLFLKSTLCISKSWGIFLSAQA